MGVGQNNAIFCDDDSTARKWVKRAPRARVVQRMFTSAARVSVFTCSGVLLFFGIGTVWGAVVGMLLFFVVEATGALLGVFTNCRFFRLRGDALRAPVSVFVLDATEGEPTDVFCPEVGAGSV